MAPTNGVRNPLPNASTSTLPDSEPEVVSTASRKSKRIAHQPAEHGQPHKKQRLTPSPSVLDRDLTETEQARREKLEKQPLAIVIDHMNVGCKRCGGLVKLTKHHLYDYSHWKTHRERCDKWSQAELEARLEKSTLISSRLSTPSLILDAGSDLTDLSDSEPEASPPPQERARAASETAHPQPVREPLPFASGPLSSHLLCAEYLAVAHPGAKTIDLNAPLEVIPEWSFANLKLPVFVNPDQAEAESRRCVLSPVDWGQVESEDHDEEFDGEDQWATHSPPPPRAPTNGTTTPVSAAGNE
ncbi:hypothetical protein L226DRAFT_510667 [Lentinus tigrinus ALCF2SS1-7]|uniref:Uncharacterized protein n=1 Tax=Lentinus tigrinus ALCF2SS1-6 TaxID=1328759 RepID=A0A5C2S7I7_9APHY|nr:hypothetical protein L227DRAFT_549969 [Lentinus tigrinus ALCF2SS1-6]RPD73270.1 hypothetical protein L226DRAFT_510667 [Lentinus tigrinus ALCF2SS1-7]